MKLITSSHSSVFVAIVILLATMSQSGRAAAPVESEQDTSIRTKTVRLIVDYGDGVKKQFDKIQWQDKMTVQDVTIAAAKHPRGIKVKQRGKKATAFLSQIDDLANAPNGRSWVYRVNGKLADRSFGIFPVKAGDTVTWTFQSYP